jgi:hypothetical protein
MFARQPINGVKVRVEGSVLTTTTTDANGHYTFSTLRAGGSYTITPQAKTSFTPASRSFNDLRRDESADFVAVAKQKEDTQTPTPPSECSDSERERIGAGLIASLGAQWRSVIDRERPQIIAATFGVDVKTAVATLGRIEFRPMITTCSAALITARYEWQVQADLPQGVKAVTVPRVKRFACWSGRGGWSCAGR